jgi:hypothetical protein
VQELIRRGYTGLRIVTEYDAGGKNLVSILNDMNSLEGRLMSQIAHDAENGTMPPKFAQLLKWLGDKSAC